MTNKWCYQLRIPLINFNFGSGEVSRWCKVKRWKVKTRILVWSQSPPNSIFPRLGLTVNTAPANDEYVCFGVKNHSNLTIKFNSFSPHININKHKKYIGHKLRWFDSTWKQIKSEVWYTTVSTPNLNCQMDHSNVSYQWYLFPNNWYLLGSKFWKMFICSVSSCSGNTFDVGS